MSIAALGTTLDSPGGGLIRFGFIAMDHSTLEHLRVQLSHLFFKNLSLVLKPLLEHFLLMLVPVHLVLGHPAVEDAGEHMDLIVQQSQLIIKVRVFLLHLGHVNGISDVWRQFPIIAIFPVGGLCRCFFRGILIVTALAFRPMILALVSLG